LITDYHVSQDCDAALSLFSSAADMPKGALPQ